MEFIGKLDKLPSDKLSEAVSLVQTERGKLRYDEKAKWLAFTDEDMQFLNAVKSRLVSQHRRDFGNSRAFAVKVERNPVDGAPILYVQCQQY